MRSISPRLAATLLAAALFVFAAVPVSAHEQFHVVEPGETLSYIALLYGVPAADIAVANSLRIDQLIYVSQTLTIPDIAPVASGVGGPSSSTIPPALSLSSGEPPAATHTVVAGDTLSRIATRYGTTIERLVQINNLRFLSLLSIGQVISLDATPPVQPPAAVPPSAPKATYVVQRGDSLYGIAGTYGMSIAFLRQLNGLGNSSLINVGQILTVQGSAPQAAPTPTPTPIPTATPEPPAPALTVQGGTYSVTFYCLRGTMANGDEVHHGAAAADASVHALGTRLWIEGWGSVTVKDRFAWDGGAKRLDVWWPNCQEAIQFGHKYFNVTVLD